jgi:hypothetical protein
MAIYLRMSRADIERARRHGTGYWQSMAAAIVAAEEVESMLSRAVALGIGRAFGGKR